MHTSIVVLLNGSDFGTLALPAAEHSLDDLFSADLVGQNDAGGLYRTAYGDLRLHLAK